MRAYEDCPRFDYCGASVCPLHDKEYLYAIRGFYADEDEICGIKDAGKYPIVQTMRRIQKADGMGLFTVEMLESLSRVGKGITGIPFEASYSPGHQQPSKKWVATRRKRAEATAETRHKGVS